MWTDVPEARLTCTTQNRKVKSTDVKLLDFCKHDKTTLKVNGKTNMLKTKIISLSLLLLSTCIATQAQKRKKTKGKAVKTEMTEEQERVEAMRERMLPSTAQVMFIDSVVTDKAGFISKIPLNSESGEIGTTGEAADTAASIPGGTYVKPTPAGITVCTQPTSWEASGRAKGLSTSSATSLKTLTSPT